MNCVERLLAAALLGVLSVLVRADSPSPSPFPSSSPSPAVETEHPKPPATVAVEYGLDPKLGGLPTENLQFKTNTNYLLDQNRAAESRFQKLRGMAAQTNYLEEFSRTVEAVLNSDASNALRRIPGS